MSWKNILTILIDGADGDGALGPARELARRNDAHLEVLTLGIDRTQTGFHYTEMSATMLQMGLKEARTAAENLEKQVEAKLKGESLRYGVTPLVAPIGAIASEIARHARFADIVVLPLPYGEGALYEESSAVEAALFEAAVPVLLVPRGTESFTPPERVVLAWNESPESLNAARAALPLLREATTYVTVIDPPAHGPERSDPGGLISQYLARHGVRCEVNVQARSLPRIGDVLLRCVSDRNADMLVMGAYGRARWSEAMFGGATRQMLEESTVPILMAH